MSSLSDMKPSDDRDIDPFIFVGDIVETSNGENEPLELAENAYLRRADSKYIQVIKHYLNPYFLMNSLGSIIEHNIYENKPVPNGSGHRFEKLSPENWQYWIVTHTNKLHEENLNISLELSDLGLTPLLYVFGPTGGSHRLIPLVAGIYLENLLVPEVKIVTTLSVDNLKNVRTLLDDFDEEKKAKYNHIDKALIDFLKLKEIPNKSPFRFLGMFSIIELLLTHNYRNSDTSINAQLQSKISLLNNRFDLPIDFNEYFQGPDTLTEGKIIEKMYKYRSDIAHGNFVDFDSELQVLHSDKKANEFLYMILKRVLVTSLKEPQLISDLKKC